MIAKTDNGHRAYEVRNWMAGRSAGRYEMPHDEKRDVPVDAPEADVAEQEREWKEGDDEPRPAIPIDAPEADYLEQERSAGLDDDDRDRDE